MRLFSPWRLKVSTVLPPNTSPYSQPDRKMSTFFVDFPKGRIPLPNQMNFWKNSERPLTPPSFLENYVAIFFKMDMVAFMQGGTGQIVSVNIN